MPDTTVETTNSKPQEDWMARRWRPMMGWMYMAVCTFDFVVAPVLWAFLQAKLGQPVTQWKPLTLEGAGLFHMAMGAVLGVAAYGRTQEKLGGANNGGLQLPSSQPAAPSAPAPTGGFATSSGFGAPAATPVATAPAWNTAPAADPFAGSAEITTGFGGKKAPPPITNFPEK